MKKMKTINELTGGGQAIGGEWSLDDRHRLSYRSADGSEQFDYETSLVAAEPGALIVSLTQKQQNGKILAQLARLEGKWQANRFNQIVFSVTRQSGKTDTLIFSGAWKLGENHEIIYSYRIAEQKRKTTRVETLTFRGRWDLTEKNALVYLMEGGSDSRFRFRAALQTQSILAKKGEIRYQIGVSGEGKKEKLRTLVFFGKWKLSTRLELVFEMECGGGQKQELRFGAEYALTEDLSVAAKLIDRRGAALGAEVILHQTFLQGNGQAFVRLRKVISESAVEAGVKLLF